jgi:hypothetical protein
MTDKPILFSAPMVRAILSGAKTQTRRIVTNRNSRGNRRASELLLDDRRTHADPGPSPAGNPGWYLHAPVNAPEVERRRKWQPGSEDPSIVERLYPWVFAGDRLWVRETWKFADWTEDGYPYIGYRDGARSLRERIPEEWGERLEGIWAHLSAEDNYRIDQRAADRRMRSPIHMPRWASRITLEITEVRVERLQDISENDAIAEGCIDAASIQTIAGRRNPLAAPDMVGTDRKVHQDALAAYRALWERINGAGSWDANPWVWVLSFKRTKLAERRGERE